MKNSIFYMVIVLSIINASMSFGQEASLQAFPDLHVSNIFSIDTDQDAKNALSLSSDGRTIFWDLETLRPLRMWEFKGIGYITKIIFNEAIGISLFGEPQKPNSSKFSKFHFIYYDLFDGNVDTLSLERDYNLDILAFDFAEGTERKQDVILLFKETLICVDLYRKKVKWSIDPPKNAQDVYYLNKDTILVYTDDAVLYFDKENQAFNPFINEKIKNFNIANVRGKFHVKDEDGFLHMEPLDPNSNNSFKFKNTAGIKVETIYEITGNDKYSYLHMNLANRSGLALINHQKEKIVWHRKIITEKESVAILGYAVALKAAKIIYTDPTRRIKIIEGKSGKEVDEIENNKPNSRSTFITPDFKHMIYSSWEDGDNGYMSNNGKKATYYVDLTNPINTQFLFEDLTYKIQKTNNNSIVILSDKGISEFDYNLGTYSTSELTFPYPVIGKIIDMEYDTLSGRMLIRSENSETREELIVKNNEIRDLIEDGVKVGIVYNQFPLYGELVPINDTESKFIFDQNITFVYNKDYLEPLAFVYKKYGNFQPTFVSGGKYVILNGEKNSRSEKYLYNVEEKKFVNPYNGSKISNIEKDLYSDLVLFRYHDKTCILVETNTFKEVKRFRLDAVPIAMVINSKLGTILYTDFNVPKKAFAYHYQDGSIGEMEGVFCQKFQDLSRDGKYLALSSYKAVQIINVEDGSIVTNEIKEFEAYIDFVKFSETRNMAISGRRNGRLNFWNLDEKRVNGTFMISPEGNYVIYDDVGIFDCHPEEMNKIFYTVRKETVDLDQLKHLFWEEDILEYLMANETYDLEEVKSQKIIRLYPDVALSTSEFQDTLIIKLTPNLGGLGQVAFYINNVEREEDVNPTNDLSEIRIPIAKYEDYLISGRPNILGVVVYNSDTGDEMGLLKSKQKRIPIRYGVKRSDNLFSDNDSAPDLADDNRSGVRQSDSDPANNSTSEGASTKGGWDDEIEIATSLMLDVEKTRLIGLVVGTSDYISGSEIDLKYADNDANSIENAFKVTGKLLFLQDTNVIIHKLISKGPDSLTSTKKNILAKMEEIQKEVKVDDILVLFFSGHGFSKDEEYYYATKDATSTTLNGKDPDMGSKTLSATEINNFLKESKSLRKLLVLDACYSGAFAEAILKKSGKNNQRRAMDKLKDKTGVYVLSSSMANQESLELPTLSQGVMTYSILEGMSGKAAIDEIIDVSTLINHVINNVPDLAKQKGYLQQPVFMSPEASMPFAIGLSDISIAPTGSKIQIGKAATVDSVFTDYLFLNDAIDEAVKVTSEQQANIPFMFNDLVTTNNIIVKGSYSQDAHGIKLKAYVIRGGKNMKTIPIFGHTVNEVAQNLVYELIKLFGNT